MKVVWLCCAFLFFGVVNCPEGRCQNEPRGTLYVQPNPPEPPTRFSPGQFYNPATLTLKIDKRPPIPWPHKESLKIDDLDVNARHLVVLTSDGKNVQSFWFRFSDFKTTDLCIGFDGYQGVQLHEKNSPLCKCQ